jgi:hypothetical protein
LLDAVKVKTNEITVKMSVSRRGHGAALISMRSAGADGHGHHQPQGQKKATARHAQNNKARHDRRTKERQKQEEEKRDKAEQTTHSHTTQQTATANNGYKTNKTKQQQQQHMMTMIITIARVAGRSRLTAAPRGTGLAPCGSDRPAAEPPKALRHASAGRTGAARAGAAAMAAAHGGRRRVDARTARGGGRRGRPGREEVLRGRTVVVGCDPAGVVREERGDGEGGDRW